MQGVILLVGVAAALGDTDLSATHRPHHHEAVPGPAGKALTNAVFHAYKTGASGSTSCSRSSGSTHARHRHTLMGQIERALNRHLRHRAGPADARRSTGARSCSRSPPACSRPPPSRCSPSGTGSVRASTTTPSRRSGTSSAGRSRSLLMMAAIALLFRWSPRRHQPAWSWLAFGVDGVGGALVAGRRSGSGFFFQASTTFSRTYGPLAGMIAILLWALLSSVAILFGAALAAQLEAVRAGVPSPRDERRSKSRTIGRAALAGSR